MQTTGSSKGRPGASLVRKSSQQDYGSASSTQATFALAGPDETDERLGDRDRLVGPVDDAVLTLTMHPQVIGQPPRLRSLGRLVDEMAARPGVRFETVYAVAARD
jgi:hypothetical protein